MVPRRYARLGDLRTQHNQTLGKLTTMIRYLLPLLLIGPLLLSTPVWAGADIAREQRQAEQIIDAILDGEPITLQAGQHPFLGIKTLAEGNPRGNLLIMHGRGIHPDWHDLINPLRVDLVEHGWNTLSIQMPVLAKTAKYYDYLQIFPEAIPRIEAAIRHLREQHPGPIILIAHSCSTHMVQHWLHQRGTLATATFDGYVGIGMGATDYQQPMQEAYIFDKIPAPILDLYAEHDHPAVINSAPKRLDLIRQAGHPLSKQLVIPDAEHEFREQGDAITTAIAAWLATLQLERH